MALEQGINIYDLYFRQIITTIQKINWRSNKLEIIVPVKQHWSTSLGEIK